MLLSAFNLIVLKYRFNQELSKESLTKESLEFEIISILGFSNNFFKAFLVTGFNVIILASPKL